MKMYMESLDRLKTQLRLNIMYIRILQLDEATLLHHFQNLRCNIRYD